MKSSSTSLAPSYQDHTERMLTATRCSGRDVYSSVRADMSASCRLRIAATEQIVDHKNELGCELICES